MRYFLKPHRHHYQKIPPCLRIKVILSRFAWAGKVAVRIAIAGIQLIKNIVNQTTHG